MTPNQPNTRSFDATERDATDPQTGAMRSEGAWSQPRPQGPRRGIEQALFLLRQHPWIVLQGLTIVPLIALALTLSQEKQYASSASLLFREPSSSLLSQNINGQQSQGDSASPEREAATNEQLADLPVVAGRAARAVGDGVTDGEVRSAITVDSSGDADVVTIEATTNSPELSARIANAYGQAYVSFRRDADRAQVAETVLLLERNLRSLSPEERVGSTADSLRRRIGRLRLERQLQTGNAELVQRAEPDDEVTSPKVERSLALGIVLGGLFGFGVAALRERLDRRLKSLPETEEVYQLPTLAKVPNSRSLSRWNQSGADALREAVDSGPEAEAFRSLRANLRYFNVDREIRSVLVSSALRGDGKSLVARHLAVTMASVGENVCFVQADLHKDDEHIRPLAQSNEGLSLVLTGMNLDDALIEVPISYDVVSETPRGLTILGSGPLPPNPLELLESERMHWLVGELERRFDVVIFDSPAISSFSDALTLVSLVRGVIVVSRLGQTTRNAALDLRTQMARLGARPLGLVANGWSPGRADRSHSYVRGG